LNEFNHSKNRLDIEVLREMNNSEVDMLDNQNLVLLLDETEKIQVSIRKHDQTSKATKKRFDELKKIFEKVSERAVLL